MNILDEISRSEYIYAIVYTASPAIVPHLPSKGQIILSYSQTDPPSVKKQNKEFAENAKKRGLEVRFYTKKTLHAKIIILSSNMYSGSANLTISALTGKNVEQISRIPPEEYPTYWNIFMNLWAVSTENPPDDNDPIDDFTFEELNYRSVQQKIVSLLEEIVR